MQYYAVKLSCSLLALNMSAHEAMSAETVPPEDSISIQGVNLYGDACQDSSKFETNISDDNLAFTITFSDFNVAINEGFKIVDVMTECVLEIDFTLPKGWQYTLASVNYRGFLDLDAGVNSEFVSYYSFHGQDYVGAFKAYTAGPYSKDFVYTDEIDSGGHYNENEWSKCSSDSRLILNPTIRLQKGDDAKYSATGIISNESVDGEFRQTYELRWRKC